jgi:hypothetical protein
MGKRLAIPRILGIEWWWLLIALSLQVGSMVWLKLPVWVPSVLELWLIFIALWLKLAEPKSRSVFFLIVSTIGSFLINRFASPESVLASIFNLVVLIVAFIGIFVCQAELESHFRYTEPRGLSLSGVMTFFLSPFYFQYHLRRLYLAQQAELLSPRGEITTPGPE